MSTCSTRAILRGRPRSLATHITRLSTYRATRACFDPRLERMGAMHSLRQAGRPAASCRRTNGPGALPRCRREVSARGAVRRFEATRPSCRLGTTAAPAHAAAEQDARSWPVLTDSVNQPREGTSADSSSPGRLHVERVCVCVCVCRASMKRTIHVAPKVRSNLSENHHVF